MQNQHLIIIKHYSSELLDCVMILDYNFTIGRKVSESARSARGYGVNDLSNYLYSLGISREHHSFIALGIVICAMHS